MIETFLTGIRQQVTAQARKDHAPETPYLPIDTQTAASLLQKSIRRGRTDFALKAGRRLFDVQPARLWRRLAVALFEDVGLLDRQLALDLIACAPKRGFTAVAWPVVAHLIGRLCVGSKTQVANNLLHIGRYDFEEATPLEDLDLLSFDEAANWIRSDAATLVQRAKVVWQLSGVACEGQVIRHPSADRERVMALLSELCDDPVLEIIAREGVRLTGHVLPLVSVLEQAVTSNPPAYQATIDPMPPEETLSGVPSWVYDQYTRAGKAALRRARSECPAIATELKRRADSADQQYLTLADAHFEFESANLSRRAQIPAHISLLRRVQALGPHRTPDNAEALYEALRAEWRVFNALRSDAVISLMEF